MTIKVGDKVPSATLRYVTPDGVQAVSTEDFFRGKKVRFPAPLRGPARNGICRAM
jgi:peroxiredoxin